jgi:CheY-like chemotaxis protein
LRQAAGETIEIFLRLDPEAGRTTVAPDALRRLLIALVSEAKKTMPEGGTLTIATALVVVNPKHLQGWPELPSGDYVMTSITARHGYPDSAPVEAAEPEFDILNVLGLVQSSGAQLDVNTKHGKSTTLRILFPKSEHSVSLLSTAVKPRSEGGPETILLAGQHPEIRAWVRLLLLQYGYAVLETVNDNHADVTFQDFGAKIDLVLLLREAGDELLPGWLEFEPRIPVLDLHLGSASDPLDTAAVDLNTTRGPIRSEEIIQQIRLKLESSRSRKAILVVDDDDSIRRMIAAVLEAAGYDVSEAHNGREALQSLARQKTQLVLTELVMPETEGLQLIQELRRAEPHIKIVAICGSPRADTYFSVARALGARAALHKPLQIEQLLRTIRQVLSTS